jgi:hypothetical protein
MVFSDVILKINDMILNQFSYIMLMSLSMLGQLGMVH